MSLKLKSGCLKCLELVSLNPFSVTGMLRSIRTVKMLTVDIQRGIDSVASKLIPGTLFDCFPNLRSLKLGSGAWSGMEALFCAGGLEVLLPNSYPSVELIGQELDGDGERGKKEQKIFGFLMHASLSTAIV